MKKIMIISSARTGHGHQSIANALTEQLNQYKDVQADVVEGFQFYGRVGVKASGIYGPVTRYNKELWKLNWTVTTNYAKTWEQLMVPFVHDRFMERLKNDPPSLIVNIHPMFNDNLLTIMRENNVRIPFITLLADLVDIHPLWVSKYADLILCPTDESVEACAALGVTRDKLHRCGFPTRRNFSEAAKNREHRPYSGDRQLECLLMSGGEGSGNLRVISEHLLKNFNSRVTVICGRNTRMKESLENNFSHYGDRIRILGFCTNVQDYMIEADVAVMRGSPNSMLEAVVCNVPLIITGSLPGQEASNPEYAQKHGLGIVCLDPKQLTPLLHRLLDDNAAGLNRIAESQRRYRNLESAGEIARLLVERALDTPPVIPSFEQRFPLLMHAAELFRKMEANIASFRNQKET